MTLLSLGVPMILMGDEVRRTQGGNNNAYCHDDESNWFDWTLVEKHADVHRFVQLLLARTFGTTAHETNVYVGDKHTTLSSHFQISGSATISPGWSSGYTIAVEVRAIARSATQKISSTTTPPRSTNVGILSNITCSCPICGSRATPTAL